VKGNDMANRSYIYLKNGDEARILTEGIYTIPYFWQLFWDEEDLKAPIALWETAEKLEEDEEQAEKFYQEQNVDSCFLLKNSSKTPSKTALF
jgi:hypothetical protein